MISYEKLTEERVDRFIELRIRQLREEGATEDIDLVPALKDYYKRHMSAAPAEGWDFCPACLRIRDIAAWVSRKNCFRELLRRRGNTDAERYRSQPRIWACFCIRISVL